MNSEQLKAITASYWRYIRQCPVIAIEVSSNLSSYPGDEMADVLVVDKARFLIETEVKVTLADLRRDTKKMKHQHFRDKLADLRRDTKKMKHQHFRDKRTCITRYFYFAVPKLLANDTKLICDDLYPYAGILGIDGTDEYGVQIYREAKPLTGKRLSFPQVLRIIFSQSSTVCRLAKKVEELTRVRSNLEEQLKKYHDRERL